MAVYGAGGFAEKILGHRDPDDCKVQDVDPMKAPTPVRGHRLLYAMASCAKKNKLVSRLQSWNTDFGQACSLKFIYYASREDLEQFVGADVLAHLPE
jgi:hypothetical protein